MQWTVNKGTAGLHSMRISSDKVKDWNGLQHLYETQGGAKTHK